MTTVHTDIVLLTS